VSPATRRVLAVAALAALAALAAAAVLQLPDFGHPRGPYATAAVRASVQERQVNATVGGVTFDVRGIDTLGEELILFCAAIGATVLLRAQRAEGRTREAAERHEAERDRTPASLRALGAALVGPVLVLGIYLLAHGHLTPGGGFQGGVILAAALLLVFAAGQIVALERVRPVDLVEVTEAAAAGAYVLMAVGGLVLATVAMENFLPFGTRGMLLSGGFVPVLNAAVGVEVAAALTLLMTEFLDQALLRRAA
jgi:multicomponent Na+:H+ antiporter subunit B